MDVHIKAQYAHACMCKRFHLNMYVYNCNICVYSDWCERICTVVYRHRAYKYMYINMCIVASKG